MEYAIGSFGPVLGLVLAFLLIGQKVPAWFALLAGALMGGLVL